MLPLIETPEKQAIVSRIRSILATMGYKLVPMTNGRYATDHWNKVTANHEFIVHRSLVALVDYWKQRDNRFIGIY